jgi:AcrR family transcriptional regulator
MREWLPVSTSPKGRLVLAALREFGRRPYPEVTVAELAAGAEVTTGAIYHHFGSKVGLYAFVRQDVERRLLDRMEGAVAGVASQPERSSAVSAALLVGLDFAVREGYPHLLGAPPAESGHDHLAELLGEATTSPVLGRVLAAAWRTALLAVAEGYDAADARAALATLHLQLPS